MMHTYHGIAHPNKSPRAPLGLEPDCGVWAAGVLEAEDAEAPHSPWDVFCLAKSPIVTFCVGVEAFLGATPPSNEAKASPPAFLGAAPPPMRPPEDMAEGVEAPD